MSLHVSTFIHIWCLKDTHRPSKSIYGCLRFASIDFPYLCIIHYTQQIISRFLNISMYLCDCDYYRIDFNFKIAV